ncbi:hypothetical protein KFE98_01165 [bacterium SCSIO 12741]|nr:hypothetical protein KFE98_01165 [bacterium SCSIO 12741]
MSTKLSVFILCFFISSQVQSQIIWPGHFSFGGDHFPCNCYPDLENKSVLSPTCASQSIESFGYLMGANVPKEHTCQVARYWSIDSEKLVQFSNYDSIHCYIGMSPDSSLHLLLVGVDSNNREDTTKIVDLIEPCPHACDTVNSVLSTSFCNGYWNGWNNRTSANEIGHPNNCNQCDVADGVNDTSSK